MQIVVYHAWKTDVSFPSVNYAERDTNEGGKWKHSGWLEELYQVGWFANTYCKNLICGSLHQWFGREGRCSQRHLGSWRTECDVSEHLKVWLGMLTIGFFFPPSAADSVHLPVVPIWMKFLVSFCISFLRFLFLQNTYSSLRYFSACSEGPWWGRNADLYYQLSLFCSRKKFVRWLLIQI